MKFLTPIVAIMLLPSMLWSQNYNYNTSTGTFSPYQYNDASAVTLLENTSSDTLSAVQTIPFAFNFYGNTVTHYRASDNGYITFDTVGMVSDPANGSLPNASGPNNAIYAFWDDLELTVTGTDDEVRNFTYGTAPNRVHVIQWYSIAPMGGSGFIYTAIRLYECGNFDIVHNWASATGLTGTIGCEDATGTNGTQVAGSPVITPPLNSNTPVDDNVYTFYWDLNQYDFGMINSGFSSFVSVGTNTVTGDLVNNGSVNISNFDVHYSVDGGPAQTMPVTTTVAAHGGTYSFSHSIPWVVATGGVNHTICIWADNLNGNGDQTNCNDTICETLFANNGVSGTKTTLLEEFTGAWCGFCPDGALIMEDMIATYPGQVVGVSIHNGDGMTFSDGIQTGFDVTAFPSGMVNRTLVSGESKEPFSRSLWDDEIANQVGGYTPVDVTVASTYNTTNRELDITVTADFVDYALGNMRFVAMLVEDSVTGTGSGYDQVNYYSSAGSAAGGSSHPHYNDPDPIVGYVHNHVLRALPGGAFGTPGIIPTSVSPGTSYNQNFTMTVPASINENNIKVIGFVAYYSTEIGERSILDVAEVTPSSFVGLNELALSGAVSVYPNPAENNVLVEIDQQVLQVNTLSLHDMTGKILHTQRVNSTQISLDLADISPGMYFVTVQTINGNAITKRLIIK